MVTTTGSGARLSFVDVVVRYGAHVAVAGVSLDVSAGSVLAVTGSNGSGKSSLIRAALGLAPLASGSIRVDDDDASTPRQWRDRRRAIAYVPQRPVPGSFPLLVHELLASSGHRDAATAAADQLGLGALLQRPLSSLSGGQLQRVYIARALGCIEAGARVLVADEPTSALDFDGQAHVAELLTTLPVTVVVVTHSAAITRVASHVVEMAGGVTREIQLPSTPVS